MDLLDLPPEIFALVIRHLVTSAGIKSAWKHRKVCRLFRRSIEFETFANQNTRAFLQTKEANARILLRKNQALYLRLRSTVEMGAYNFLPRFVKRVSEFVCSPLPRDDYVTRKKYTQVICKLLIKGQKDNSLQALIETKAPESSSKFAKIVPNYHEDVTSNYIAAAAAVGDLQALRDALQNNLDEVWQKSPIFGYPLAVAAAGRHSEVVGAIVKHFEHTQERTHMGDHQCHFVTATTAAFSARDQEIALLLLRVVHAYGSPVDRDTWKTWMLFAIIMRNSDIIHQVRITRRMDVTDVSREFEAACKEGDLEAVRVFIDEGFVPMRCSLSRLNYTPIQTAVLSKKHDVVELVLKMGANPNGDWVSHPEARPLWMAIMQNRKRTTRALLYYGADPGLVMDSWAEQKNSFKAARTDIWDLMIAALKRGNFYTFPTVPLTKFAIDAPDLVVSNHTDETETRDEDDTMAED